MQNQQSNMKAGLWMAAWLALMLGMTIASREVTRELNVLQLMELRSVIGFVMLLPLVFASGGFAAMRTKRPAQHIGRNIAHYVGQALWLYALTLIPLAHLISIEFTSPLWTALLAVAFLGERLNARKIAAIALGLVGVAVIVRPGVTSMDPGHLVVLAAAFAFGISVAMVKSLTRTEFGRGDHLLDADHPVGHRPRAGLVDLALAFRRDLALGLRSCLLRQLRALLPGSGPRPCRRDRGHADGFPARAADGAGRLPAL